MRCCASAKQGALHPDTVYSGKPPCLGGPWGGPDIEADIPYVAASHTKVDLQTFD